MGDRYSIHGVLFAFGNCLESNLPPKSKNSKSILPLLPLLGFILVSLLFSVSAPYVEKKQRLQTNYQNGEFMFSDLWFISRHQKTMKIELPSDRERDLTKSLGGNMFTTLFPKMSPHWTHKLLLRKQDAKMKLGRRGGSQIFALPTIRIQIKKAPGRAHFDVALRPKPCVYCSQPLV